jgi:hypothetical protein
MHLLGHHVVFELLDERPLLPKSDTRRVVAAERHRATFGLTRAHSCVIAGPTESIFLGDFFGMDR